MQRHILKLCKLILYGGYCVTTLDNLDIINTMNVDFLHEFTFSNKHILKMILIHILKLRIKEPRDSIKCHLVKLLRLCDRLYRKKTLHCITRTCSYREHLICTKIY